MAGALLRQRSSRFSLRVISGRNHSRCKRVHPSSGPRTRVSRRNLNSKRLHTLWLSLRSQVAERTRAREVGKRNPIAPVGDFAQKSPTIQSERIIARSCVSQPPGTLPSPPTQSGSAFQTITRYETVGEQEREPVRKNHQWHPAAIQIPEQGSSASVTNRQSGRRDLVTAIYVIHLRVFVTHSNRVKL